MKPEKQCSICDVVQLLEVFDGGTYCPPCRSAYQKFRRNTIRYNCSSMVTEGIMPPVTQYIQLFKKMLADRKRAGAEGYPDDPRA